MPDVLTSPFQLVLDAPVITSPDVPPAPEPEAPTPPPAGAVQGSGAMASAAFSVTGTGTVSGSLAAMRTRSAPGLTGLPALSRRLK